MNFSAEQQKWACDTSVAIASVDPLNPAHQPCRKAVLRYAPSLSGHAAFESFSVLTRMPLPLRLRPAQAGMLLSRAFPVPCWLTPDDKAAFLTRLPTLGVSGGAVYDALVAEAARTNGCILMTIDRRAESTYRSVGVTYRFVDQIADCPTPDAP